MKVYQDFFSYESGIYKHAPTAELYESGYHSVRIIGWGEGVSTDRGLPIKYWVSVGNSRNFAYYLRTMKWLIARMCFLSAGGQFLGPRMGRERLVPDPKGNKRMWYRIVRCSGMGKNCLRGKSTRIRIIWIIRSSVFFLNSEKNHRYFTNVAFIYRSSRCVSLLFIMFYCISFILILY